MLPIMTSLFSLTVLLVTILTTSLHSSDAYLPPCHHHHHDNDVSSLYCDAENVTGTDWVTASRTARDVSVCERLVTSESVNVRSTCPWHYEEEEQDSMTWPRRLLTAKLTCGSHCLRVHDGVKKSTPFICKPVTREVALWRCSTSPCGRQTCQQESVQVPVAFTCAFPSVVM